MIDDSPQNPVTRAGEHALDAAKSTPIAAWFAAHFSGYTIPDLINALTLIYALAMVIQKAYQFRCWWIARRAGR